MDDGTTRTCGEVSEPCDAIRIFALGKCRKHYERELRARHAAGVEVTPGPTPRSPTEVICTACGKQFRGERRRVDAAAAGRPVYCSRKCQQGRSRVSIACYTCGTLTQRYRSQGYDETSRVFCREACATGVGHKPRSGTEEPCGSCGKPVYRSLSEAAAVDQRYCDAACFARSLTGERVERLEVPCEVCGTVMRLEPDQRRQGVRTHKDCAPLLKRRRPGERYIDPSGYAWVTTPDGRNMLEHRWVMEQKIGRPLLSEETVHHKTEGKRGRSNNLLSNLELWTGRHPRGHRVEDVVGYSRQILALYGTEQERGRYAAHLPSDME